MEECGPIKAMSRDHEECEQDFKKSVTRNESGRFIVKLPIREGVGELGDSFEIAKKRFFATEAKLNRNAEFKQNYCLYARILKYGTYVKG